MVDRRDPDLQGAELFEFELDQDFPATASDDDIETDAQSIVQRMLEEAMSYREENIEPDQVDATDYYFGREFGNEEDGRSKVVSTDLRDAVLQVMPSLLRIFVGSERAVEYRPERESDAAGAAQATDYVQYIVHEDNPGFLVFHSWFKDALVRRIGIVKWWWNELTRKEETKHTDLTENQVMVLLQDQEVDVKITSTEQVPPAMPEAPPTTVYNVTVTHKSDKGDAKIETIPPEEFIYSPDARSIDDAAMVAHVRDVPQEELLEMGVPQELIDESIQQSRTSSSTMSDDLKSARHVEEEHFWVGDIRAGTGERALIGGELPESLLPVVYAEAYVYFDGDDDGIAELRRFDCIGPHFKIIPDENGEKLGTIVSSRPFAVITPDPEPHTIMGMGFWDLLKDVQKVKSQIQRGMLDSLGLAIDPQQEVVANAVNMQDLLNPELGGLIRVRQPGMIREVKHGFVGPDTLPVLAYYDEIKEGRSGQSKASQGLDPDVLQSTTKAAVSATVTAAQQRIEMIARVFAETGVKRLFHGLLELVIENQDQSRMIRLRDEFVEVDPRSWNANMDVRINVALGTGLIEEKIALLGMVAGKQQELLQMGSPIVSNVELRATLARMVELAGWRNAAEFWKPWTEQQEQQMQQAQAQQPPPPDPAQMLIQIEGQKAQAEAANDQAKLQLETQKAYLEDDRQRDKVAREMALKEHEIEAKYAIEIDDRQIKNKIERDRMVMDADLKQLQAMSGGGNAQ